MKQNLLLVGCLCVQFHGATELHDAAITGDIKKAQEFIDRYPGLINAPDVAYGGWPALDLMHNNFCLKQERSSAPLPIF